MDEIKAMIDRSYLAIQDLDLKPTEHNLNIIQNVMKTLATCFKVVSVAKVVPNEENKEEQEDGNNDTEPRYDETGTR